MLPVFILGSVRKEEGEIPQLQHPAMWRVKLEQGGSAKTAPQTAAGDGFEAQISLPNPSCFLQSPSPISQLQLSGFLPSSRPLISLSSKGFAGLTPRSQEHQDSRDGVGSAGTMRSHLEEPPCAITGSHANVGTQKTANAELWGFLIKCFMKKKKKKSTPQILSSPVLK